MSHEFSSLPDDVEAGLVIDEVMRQLPDGPKLVEVVGGAAIVGTDANGTPFEIIFSDEAVYGNKEAA